MTSAHNLTRHEARERAGLLRVASYEVDLDLTVGETNFLSTSTVRFGCTVPGASTFIEIGADGLESLTLNGRAWTRRTLPDSASRCRTWPRTTS